MHPETRGHIKAAQLGKKVKRELESLLKDLEDYCSIIKPFERKMVKGFIRKGVKSWKSFQDMRSQLDNVWHMGKGCPEREYINQVYLGENDVTFLRAVDEKDFNQSR